MRLTCLNASHAIRGSVVDLSQPKAILGPPALPLLFLARAKLESANAVNLPIRRRKRPHSPSGAAARRDLG